MSRKDMLTMYGAFGIIGAENSLGMSEVEFSNEV